MIQKYEKLNVNKLKIEKEFNCQSSDKIITLNAEGVNMTIEKINLFRQVSNLEKIQNLFETYSKICQVLNIDICDNPNWINLIGKKSCKEYNNNLLQEIKFSNSFLTTYHTEILPKRISLYENITSVLDKDLQELDIPVYEHSSVSGRTTISKGFNFLTSTKEFRKTCKSKTSEHLVSIDMKSFEPNLYLSSINKKTNTSDIYEYLMKELDIKVENRNELKRAILSVLYGASDDTARRLLSGNDNALKKIKSFFEIDEMTKILQEEFNKSGFIFNMYGRPIFSDKSILNKWIQSSAVDFCSLAFSDLLKKEKLSAAYFVHDDMVVNCNKKEYENIKNIKNITDPITKISLPVEVSLLT